MCSAGTFESVRPDLSFDSFLDGHRLCLFHAVCGAHPGLNSFSICSPRTPISTHAYILCAAQAEVA